MVKNYLWVFVNCLVENPAFDSQVGARDSPTNWPACRGVLCCALRLEPLLSIFPLSHVPPPARQTKDTLTLRASAFGSKCELPDAYMKKVANCGIVDQVGGG